ncbi:MAG TPA: hypothetical protein VGF01_09710, partial [Terracidiphilus sp.]
MVRSLPSVVRRVISPSLVFTGNSLRRRLLAGLAVALPLVVSVALAQTASVGKGAVEPHPLVDSALGAQLVFLPGTDSAISVNENTSIT